MPKRRDTNELFTSPEERERIVAGQPTQCFARRHMGAAQFLTYNTMLAVSLAGREENEGKLIFKAGAYWLANANNRSVNQEREALAKLEESGWIVNVRKKLMGTNWYEVIEHEEFLLKHPNSCPPNRYADNLMADVLGIDKHSPVGRESEEMPDNFAGAKLRAAADSVGWPELAEYLGGLDSDARAKILEHWKKSKG